MSSTNLEEYAAYYLERIEYDENARFSLVEAPAAILPLLVSAFRSESDPVKRSAILNIIWQRRDPSAVPPFGEGLPEESTPPWGEKPASPAGLRRALNMSPL